MELIRLEEFLIVLVVYIQNQIHIFKILFYIILDLLSPRALMLEPMIARL